MIDSNIFFHKPLKGLGIIDEVVIRIKPRWKDSHISGSEWRHNFYAEIKAKGETVHTVIGSGLKDVSLNVLRFAMGHDDTEDAIKAHERFMQCCDQPGCREEPEFFYKIRKQYSAAGEELTPSNCNFKYYRKFCDKHNNRGDSALEDSNINYQLLDGDPRLKQEVKSE